MSLDFQSALEVRDKRSTTLVENARLAAFTSY
jgi:hypothetical protein